MLTSFMYNIKSKPEVWNVNMKHKFLSNVLHSQVLILFGTSMLISILLHWQGIFPRSQNIRKGPFTPLLNKLSDKDNRIFIIYVDLGYVNLALNLHFFLRNLTIRNYLFVCTDIVAANILAKEGINFYLFENDPTGNHSSIYKTPEYRRKTLLKNKIVLTVLQHGFHTFLLDADIALFRNPLEFLSCPSCDMQFQCDTNNGQRNCHLSYNGNTGCYFARSSSITIGIFSYLQREKQFFSWTEQKLMVEILKTNSVVNLFPAKIGYFDSRFANGFTFFSIGNRIFFGEHPCFKCVLVHNNYMNTVEAKIYRFKERQLWFVNPDEYYTSSSRKYLLYENPYTFPLRESLRTKQMEEYALFSALAIGKLLGRIVILPRFHCYRPREKRLTNNCSLLSLFEGNDLIKFDREFGEYYRESVFLKHPWVPFTVRDSLSDIILIKSKAVMEKISKHELRNVSHVFTPMDLVCGATGEEIWKWIHESLNSYKVLRFHSLYNAVKGLNQSLNVSVFS